VRSKQAAAAEAGAGGGVDVDDAVGTAGETWTEVCTEREEVWMAAVFMQIVSRI
jgi:hypothetical protein